MRQTCDLQHITRFITADSHGVGNLPLVCFSSAVVECQTYLLDAFCRNRDTVTRRWWSPLAHRSASTSAKRFSTLTNKKWRQIQLPLPIETLSCLQFAILWSNLWFQALSISRYSPNYSGFCNSISYELILRNHYWERSFLGKFTFKFCWASKVSRLFRLSKRLAKKYWNWSNFWNQVTSKYETQFLTQSV